MTKLIFIRHGQSMANVYDVYVGHTDSPLSALGEAQAERTAEYIAENFKVDKVYASDLSRAFNTGKAVSDKMGIEIVADKELREILGGIWENKPFSELIEKYGEAYQLWLTNIGEAGCPEGESVRELQKRIVAEVKKIGKENEGKTIVIATHATPIRVLQTYCEGKSLSEMKDVSWVSNASLTFVDYENGELILKEVGYDKHLGDMKTVLPKNV